MKHPSEFNCQLLAWFRQNKRDLPWRKPCRDPYAVWVSEIMLQQTTVATVVPYFVRWMATFPTVQQLASAAEQEVLAHWQGLGYYSRAKRLHQAAIVISEKNRWPHTYEDWLAIPGIGPYTAAAISSIVSGEAKAVVDANVERVYARLQADHSSGSELKRKARDWANLNFSRDAPGSWNEAVMELGATVCTPKSPRCSACPIVKHCAAQEHGLQNDLPMRPTKPEWKHVRHVAWIPVFEEMVGIRRVPEGNWWAGLWDFPRVEQDSRCQTRLCQMVGDARLRHLGRIRHVVTRHKVEVDVHVAEVTAKSDRLWWVRREVLPDYALPTPARKMFKLLMTFETAQN